MPTAAAPSCTLLVLVCLAGGACGDDHGGDGAERPPIVWKGEHVQVGTLLELDGWCPGTLARLDDYAAALKDRFHAPEAPIINYYLYAPPLSSHDLCGGNRACVVDGDVSTPELLDIHELVHAVSATFGSMPHFFEEGAASYWGRHYAVDFRGLDIREVLAEHWSSGADPREYALAAHFTSYLVHTHGDEPYVALLQATSRDQSRSEFEATFADILGVSLDQAIDDYEANWPYCDPWAAQSSFYECGRPATVVTPGEGTEFDLDISCADPEVVGPSALGFPDRVPRIWRDLTIAVEVDQPSQIITFDVPAVGEANTVLLEVKRCDSYCGDASTWPIVPDRTEDPNVFVLSGAAGRYVLRVSRAADDPGPVRFRWQ
ncbi:hypothetical protein OV203_26175 [Nannocystis sp. ILAH1]|uniref:hypothetical protein n=1 Tax=Nannocystis sp. ILAH1 TaxID=2996789 RepID=UPI00226F8CE0|nr:hypothetical protein [Nannocystis sp. ILAH1]MCY0990658.1 hypothetical protein [Nannocystis sp. ILAH1]